MKIMTLFREEAPANFVPAAAVIRRGRALSGMIGRKVLYRRYLLIICKILGLLLRNAYNTFLLEYSRR